MRNFLSTVSLGKLQKAQVWKSSDSILCATQTNYKSLVVVTPGALHFSSVSQCSTLNGALREWETQPKVLALFRNPNALFRRHLHSAGSRVWGFVRVTYHFQKCVLSTY